MAPPTCSIRLATPADAARIARVQVDTWRLAYRGVVSDEYLASMGYEDREERWRLNLADPGRATLVAAGAGGDIVGFASVGSSRHPVADFDGELYAIYILPSHQGCGLGRRLVARGSEWLLKHGYRSMLVWVLAENPARKFYERLGGRAMKEDHYEIGGSVLRCAAYGWTDIAALVVKESDAPA